MTFSTYHARKPEYNKKGDFKRSNRMYSLSYSTEKKEKGEKKEPPQFEIQTPACPFHTFRQKFRVVYRIERLKTWDMLKFHCFQAKITSLALKMHEFWKLACCFMRSLRMHWKIIYIKNYLC